MGEVIKIIEEKTDGKSFKSHRYCNDAIEISGIEYDDNEEVVWKDYGETERQKHCINLKERADLIKNEKSLFAYFLDGSRHTYKVDDITYNKNVYPIVVGQIGVGCCSRKDKLMGKEKFYRNMVIALPEIACRDEWSSAGFFNELLKEINQGTNIKTKFGFEFDKILTYSKENQDDKLEKKGVAAIQDCMIELEKEAVCNLVMEGKLNQDNYLIKDGSIEYKKMKNSKNLTDKRIANSYKFVVGVSKSFNPTKCFVKSGGSNSDIIANLKPFERTPAYMYQSKMSGDAYFVIWYLRLREAKYTKNVFDGVVKVEKLVITESEQIHGVDSELIDLISSNLLNERNPVCYGDDGRWANHIYPIYLTEKFVKSKYLSNHLFMQLF